MADPAVPTRVGQPIHSPGVDELFLRLKEYDSDWLSHVLHERWLQLAQTQPCRKGECNTSSQSPVWPFDVTLPRLPPQLTVSDYVKSIREHDWSSTDLGPMDGWSVDLRRMVNMCLCDKRAAALWIGPTHIAFYNEGYSVIAGQKHPKYLGQTFEQMWPEPGIAKQFSETFERGMSLGVSSSGDYAMYTLERYGYREEMWASWSVVPIPDSVGGVFGCYNVVIDVTRKQVSERRLSTLLSLGQNTAYAANIEELWQQILATFESNPHDVPFATVYSLANAKEIEKVSQDINSSDKTMKIWHLEGTIGLPASFSGFPLSLDTDGAVSVISPAFQIALAKRQPVLLTIEDDTFPSILRGVAKSSIGGDLCTAALLLPIGPTNRDNILGFMLVGVNPLSRYDADYERFAQLLMRQCATSLASVVLMEEEVRQSRLAVEAAARDRILLSEKLAQTQTQVVENEARFRNMADMAPVAMFHLDEQGNILYANKIWLELTQHPAGEFGPKSWSQFVHPDDQALADKEFSKLTRGESVNFEMRWRTPFNPESEEYVGGERVEGATWTIASAYAEKRADGSVKSILGCLTDISRQKWIEGFQERRAKGALELKRQQENFMDMISHETRNPLSAIMLSVESIASGLRDLSSLKHDPVTVTQETVRSYLESAEVIMACAQHQKRIVDDVLTLSKLDSGLLTICPVEVRPVETVAQALKMFDAELQKHDVALTFDVDESYEQLQLQWMRLDPSRLLQILINLITNAIKFTATEAIRQIRVTLSASLKRPVESLHGALYVQHDGSEVPPIRPDEVFLSLEVVDTGCGITYDEMKKLFNKFQQANPKTHVEYGGSGLGLFISRQLSQMQGGAIGVASSGKGATFAFYIVASRCPAPVTEARGRRRTRKSTPTSSTSPEAIQSSSSAPISARKRRHLSQDDSVDPERFGVHPRRQMQILLVEDNLVNQKVMRTMLERAQYTVHVANHGLEALDYISHTNLSTSDGTPLDVVLMDVEMPVCDGLECARRIRELQQMGQLNAHLPIVGVTANARTEQQLAAIAAGMDAVVTKPFRMAELAAELESIARRFYRAVDAV